MINSNARHEIRVSESEELVPWRRPRQPIREHARDEWNNIQQHNHKQGLYYDIWTRDIATWSQAGSEWFILLMQPLYGSTRVPPFADGSTRPCISLWPVKDEVALFYVPAVRTDLTATLVILNPLWITIRHGNWLKDWEKASHQTTSANQVR